MTTVQRLPDWPERLAAFIEQRRHRPFAWGDNDCASFAAGAVAAMTGTDTAAWLPGSWVDEEAAASALRAGGGMGRIGSQVLGAPVRGPAASMVGRGSVVCVRLPRATLGVAAGNGYWCAPGAAGLVWRPMSEVRRAWEI